MNDMKWMLCALLALGSCGGSSKGETVVSTPAPEPELEEPIVDAAGDNESDAPAPEEELPEPPIEIPNGRLVGDYVVGGLPSKAQIDAALAAGFESTMISLD